VGEAEPTAAASNVTFPHHDRAARLLGSPKPQRDESRRAARSERGE
jgi:hypothetical protein